MPYRGRSKKRTYRRRPRRRRYRSRRRAVPRPISRIPGLPPTMVVRFRYNSDSTLNAAAGAIAVRNYRANSCNDPDSTGFGTQPLMWDNFAALYGQARVLYSDVTTRFTANSESVAGSAGYCGVSLVTPTDVLRPQNVIVYPRTKHSMISTPEGGKPFAVVKYKYMAKRWSGRKVLNNDQLSFIPDTGSSGTIPLQEAFFAIWYRAVDTAFDPGTIYINTTLTYTIMFSQPIVQQDS